MKKLFIILLFVCINFSNVYSQSLGYYSLGNTVSIGTNPHNKFWTELRLMTNTISYYDEPARGATQISILYNLKRGDNTDIYLGTGVGYPIFSDVDWGYFPFIFGFHFKPFKGDFKNISLQSEFQAWLFETYDIEVHPWVSIGARYTFLKNEKKKKVY